MEALENRTVPASLYWPLANSFAEHESNDLLNGAENLGKIAILSPLQVKGKIGNGAYGAADVDWYKFSLDAPSLVNLCAMSKQLGSPLKSVLSLYALTPFEFGDQQNPFGFRLLNQDDGATHGGEAAISRSLGAGTYYVALSGSGNRYFNPGLAGSGYAGSTGDYSLQVSSQILNLTAADGPAVLAADPSSGSALSRSPIAIRVSLSSPLDMSTVSLGTTVKLLYSRTGAFGSGATEIAIRSANFSQAMNELQLFPGSTLAAGYYQLKLFGNSVFGDGTFLEGLDGKPLGLTASNPSGKTFSTTFQVAGVEGASSSDDTLNTSHDLGDITSSGLVQIAGAIGDDASDPVPYNPADVDIYHFRITGPGRYQLASEAFAGRIGSPLDAGLTLFKKVNGELTLVAVNNNSNNDAKTDDGFWRPLYIDPVLYAGLEAGDYYIAVSSVPNTPDINVPWSSGPNPGGIFDPMTSHSGRTGFGPIGRYVLNLAVNPDNVRPTVVATSITAGAIVANSPTSLTVTYSEAVNLTALGQKAYDGSLGDAKAVFIEANDGTRYIPRLMGYDQSTNQAHFMMLDGLANGIYRLHLSSAEGLADFAGNRLVGNDPSGDYVITFTVSGPIRGNDGNPLFWANQESNDTIEDCQELGVLFPRELVAGVKITREANLQTEDVGDYFRIEVLQAQSYHFNLTEANLPENAVMVLYDADGNLLKSATTADEFAMFRTLAPGSYVVGVGLWNQSEAANVSYQLNITMLGMPDWPPPLTTGPGPAIRIQFATDTPPTGNPSPPAGTGATPQITLPTTTPTSPAASVGSSAPAFPSVYIPPTLLGAGPLGGVNAATGGTAVANMLTARPDQVVIRPESMFTDSLLRMAVLTSTGTYSGGTESDLGEAATQEPNSADGGIIRSILDSWQRTLDALFGMTGWLNRLPISNTASTPASELIDTTGEVSMEDTVELDAAWAQDAFAPAEQPSMIAALATVGMLATVRAPRKRRRRRKLLSLVGAGSQ